MPNITILLIWSWPPLCPPGVVHNLSQYSGSLPRPLPSLLKDSVSLVCWEQCLFVWWSSFAEWRSLFVWEGVSWLRDHRLQVLSLWENHLSLIPGQFLTVCVCVCMCVCVYYETFHSALFSGFVARPSAHADTSVRTIMSQMLLESNYTTTLCTYMPTHPRKQPQVTVSCNSKM